MAPSSYASVPLTDGLPAASCDPAVPWSDLAATAQYSGDGLAVGATLGGTVRLPCVFQRLEGEVTQEGLWLSSMADNTAASRFRVIANSVGRDSVAMGEFSRNRAEVAPVGPRPAGVSQRETPPQGPIGSSSQRTLRTMRELSRKGIIACQEGAAQFVRDGLVEEYSVSMDGVRQDFLIASPPTGNGMLRIDLAVIGAQAEAVSDGAQLILKDSGRKIAYSRLLVIDAAGHELKARLDVVSQDRLAVLVDDVNAVYPVRIDPTFSDANWVSMGGLRGANGIIRATATDDMGNLYVGGEFTVIGTVFANHIAKWNGFEWSALSAGMNNMVRALAVSGTNLYAAGDFTTAGGRTANRIAKWNGSAWSALGSGMANCVHALAVSGNNLFAGGEFFGAGGVYTWRIAQWNGRVWSAVGTGEGPNGPVYALAVFGTNLYVGGDFSYVDRVDTGPIAKWNGRGWSSLDFGLAMGGSIHALAVSGNTLFVGGDFRGAGQGFENYNYIAKWNGSKWSALGSGMNSQVYALAVSGNTLYAGGGFTWAGEKKVNYIAKWNGNTWSSMGTGIGEDAHIYTVFALAAFGSTVYAGGDFVQAGVASAKYVAQWNGNSWSSMGTGFDEAVGPVAVSGTNLYVGGIFTTAGGTLANHVARWDGNGWTALGSGLNDSVHALALSGTNLYVGGTFTQAGGVNADRIAKWDGHQWSALGLGIGGWMSSPSVYALAVVGTNLYAGGWFFTAGGMAITNLAKWDGNSWSSVGNAMAGAFLTSVRALAVSGTNLYAAKVSPKADNTIESNVSEWDGNRWANLGSAAPMTSAYFSALAASGTDLYAGGWFSEVSGITATNIARWDGKTWSALGSGVNGKVYALVASGANLCAGGEFTRAGGVAANYIAKWNGTAWSALGSGMGGMDIPFVYGLAASATDLYVGGGFATAGNKVSAHVAKAVLIPPDPFITIQPSNQTILVNGTGTFSVSATGSLPLLYQWRFGEANLTGQTNPSLVLTGVTTNQAGSYDVVVSNTSGSITSTVAMLRISDSRPIIFIQPANQTVTVGGAATFTFSAMGGLPLFYQWRFGGVNLMGQTNASLVLTNVTGEQAGSYDVVVTNASGSVVSSVAALTVAPTLGEALDAPLLAWTTGGNAPWIGQTGITHDGVDAAQSGLLKIAEFQESWLETSLTGPGSLSFWWKASSITGDDFLIFLTNGVEVARITGEPGWANRAFALSAGRQILRWRFLKTDDFTTGWDMGWLDQVTFTPPTGPPVIESQSAGEITADLGTTTTFSVSATGSLPLLYQWRFKGTNLVGQTNASLVFASVTMEQAGPYDVVVRNTSGSVTSLVVSLIVRDTTPVIYTQPADAAVGLGGTATFTVLVSSWLPLTYQWRFRGLNLADQTNSSLVLVGVTTNQAGPYDVVVATTSGSVISSVATLTVGLSLGEALDAPQLLWTTGGNDVWAGFTTVTHDGIDAAQSGSIAGNEETWMETSVTGPGSLLFWWKVSSIRDYEHLELWTNSMLAARITGEIDWTKQTLSFGAGLQILRWRFVKQLTPMISNPYWSWVDQVSFVPSGDPLRILVQDPGFGLRSNRFGFNVAGSVGQVIVVEVSTNLLQWLPLQTNTLGNEPFYFSDPSTSVYRWRFYRARLSR